MSLATETRPDRGRAELARASEALAELSRALTPVAVETFKPLEDALSDWRKPRTAGDLGPDFPSLLAGARRGLRGEREREAFNRALVAHLASGLHLRLESRRLPEDVRERIPAALERLHAFLGEERSGYEPGDECFLRDVRFAAGWSVPCGSEVLDLRARLSPPASLRAALAAGAPGLALRRLRPGGADPWFAPHTETRYLDEFDEAGWEATYRNVASLLRRHTDVVGVTGYSWFYDPALDQISPRLAYLRRRPLGGGAILLRGRSSDFDVRNALAKSQTRRRLYEAGRYTPVGYQMVWLRRDLLRWAERGRRASD
ncbi:MAG TPA: hypothetical protein VH501_02795 [Solirubrobacterales bacterium]|jgi:hypothetical protein